MTQTVRGSSQLAVHGGEPALRPGTLPAGWPVHDEAEHDAVTEVVSSGKWGSTHGDVIATFEREFAAYQDAAHAVCLCNGTLAIVAALRAAGVGIGDEVVVPSYTFIATASAALFVGAVPVFADVDPDTHLMDPASAESAITDRTKAVIVVHVAGRPADMDAFAALGQRRGITVVEDAAQAHGAAYRGRRVGALADLGTFSFQSSKNITAGEGGAVVTNNDQLARALYSVVNVGRVPDGAWYQHVTVGYNLRLPELQGAILRAQLARHPELQHTRESNAALLTELLGDVDGVRLPPQDPAVTAHGRHLFPFRVPELGAAGKRDAVVRALAAEGVGASPGYRPLHRHPALLEEAHALTERLGQSYPARECPVTNEVCADTIWLPQPYLLGTTDQTHAVANAIAKVIAGADSLPL